MTLQEFFKEHSKVAIALSGGTDSAYLLYAAKEAGTEVAAYYLDTAFQPAFAFENARRLAEELSVPLKVVTIDVLCDPNIRENPENRCYFCKKAMMTALLEAAQSDGYPVLLDGSNASDRPESRPGMAAAAELGVLSPLALCGITKFMVRNLSHDAGLFTWDLPAYACLATRIPAGTPICVEDLRRVEEGEKRITALGFTDLRIRLTESFALLQLPVEQVPFAFEKREEILFALKDLFPAIALDFKGR